MEYLIIAHLLDKKITIRKKKILSFCISVFHEHVYIRPEVDIMHLAELPSTAEFGTGFLSKASVHHLDRMTDQRALPSSSPHQGYGCIFTMP